MIEGFYDTTAVVSQPTRTQNEMGGIQLTFSTRIAALMCRPNPKTIQEADQYGKMTLREVWKLYCEASTTNKAIDESDRVVFNSRTFEVTGIANPGNQDHHLEIDLSEIR